MVKPWSLAIRALCVATAVSRAAADGQGAYLWDPPVDNEADVYAHVIELQHAGDLNGKLLATWEHWYTIGANSAVTNGSGSNFIIRESDDGGNSWTTLTTVNDTETGPGHPFALFWEPFLFEYPVALGNYPAGTLLLVGNLVPKNKTFTEFYTWRSTNHGQTWDSVGAWQQGGSPGAGIWEPFLFVD